MTTPTFENTIAKVLHVDGISKQRQENYLELNKKITGFFSELDTEAVLLKSLDSLDEYYEEFPFLKNYSRRHFSTVYVSDGAFCGDDGTVSNSFSFPTFPGEIGIYLSMYRAMKNFLKTDYKFFLYVEDDNFISEYFENNFPIYMSNVYFDFDVLFLGTRPYYFNLYNEYFHNIGNGVFCKPYMPTGLDGILVSRVGAQKIIDTIDNYPISYPIDWLLFNARANEFPTPKFKSYSIKPEYPQLFIINIPIAKDSIIATEEWKLNV